MSQALKLSVINTARGQVGAHYLWSAAGNTPGNADGAYYRADRVKRHPDVPDPDQLDVSLANPKGPPFVPTLFAAYAETGDEGTLACAGRAALLGGLPFACDLDLTHGIGPALILKLSDLTRKQREAFKANAARPDAFRWPRPNGSIANNNAAASTVWGEPCVGKRHFDCIGFINWCLSTTLQREIWYGIENFTGDPNRNLKPLFPEVSVTKAELGDIVTISLDVKGKDGKMTRVADHIGIVTDSATVIDAMDPAHGVMEDGIGVRGWTQCFRLPDGEWRLGAQPPKAK